MKSKRAWTGKKKVFKEIIVITNDQEVNFNFSKMMLLFIFAAFCLCQSITTRTIDDSDSDLPHTQFSSSKLSHFGVLSSIGSCKSRLNIFSRKLPPKNLKNFNFLAMILMLSSDVQMNPGPRSPKYPCGICSKACLWSQPAVACDSCQVWYHTGCMGMNSKVYNALKKCLMGMF